ncbi:hypothetical protein [Paenibacillus chitinolyticus]|uniref:Uncharacterized protein n=1 Tax=Paenibacillus chitinolyticus TaxID=79263 RepID=A0ABT4FCI9_9BACL|nr:hypothetical protein [Paenibacillus chitinolyticus]MCY9589901.1 hypothetical protein [Paenibacillus chitinolyticus]MCY9596238.1 hypothetical protein [Paenibacillus chitinolyticus]
MNTPDSTNYQLQLWFAAIIMAMLALVRGRRLPTEKMSQTDLISDVGEATASSSMKGKNTWLSMSFLPSKSVWILSIFFYPE